MPRYYFEVADGRSSSDQVGTMLNDKKAARREALRRAAILLRVTQSTVETLGQKWTIRVTDEVGDIVFEIDAKPGTLDIHQDQADGLLSPM